jgi:hypothetical protein
MAAKRTKRRKRKASGATNAPRASTLGQATLIASRFLPMTSAALDAIVPVALRVVETVAGHLDEAIAREVQARLTGRRG